MKSVILWLFVALLLDTAGVGTVQQLSDEKKLEALSDIRRELACYCGCSLTVEDCLRSMRCSESSKLSEQVIEYDKAGKTKAEIIQAMVATYGETILSAPTKKGLNLAAWVLPFLALGVGGVVALVVVRKWRSQSGSMGGAAARAATEAASGANVDPYMQKVEDELKQLER